LATTMRVVDGVHDHATDGRANALPPHAAGLTPVDVGLLGVADLAHRGAAPHVDPADLTGGHAEGGVGPLLTEPLDAPAGGAGHLGAAARTELHRVHHGACGDVPEREVVAGLDVGACTRLDLHALLQVARGEDVPLLTVRVVQEGDVGGAV